MKTYSLVAIAAATLLAACTPAPTLRSHSDTLSWALGENIAHNIASQTTLSDIDNDILIAAIRHTLDSLPQPLPDSAYQLAMRQIISQSRQRQTTTQPQNQPDIDAAQQQYLRQLLANNPNVKRHPAGFCYEILRPGHGPNATYAQRIRFDFKSYLMLSGQPYDQTYGNRESIIHVVGNPMFPGLIQAFQLMNAGSLYRFYFPYQLAFGEKGSGNIPGYTPLIYDIELHELYKD